MKNYKDYNKTYIGSSDSAYLTLKTITGTTEKLCFGEELSRQIQDPGRCI